MSNANDHETRGKMKKTLSYFCRRASDFMLGKVLVVLMVLQFMVSPATALDVPRDYLDREYDWTIFVDASAVEQYLNYKGSKLHPLTKVRVSVQKSPRSLQNDEEATEYVYEDFWYYKGKPIGLHRKHKLDIRQGLCGLVVIRHTSNQPGQVMSVTNAALRVLVDLQYAKLVTNTFMVAEEDYEEVSGCLNEFGFYKGIQPSAGKQLGIDLRTFPTRREERFYLLVR